MRRRILSPVLIAAMLLATLATGAAIGTVGAQPTDPGEAAAVDAGVQFDHNETHNETLDDNETVDDGNETVDEENETDDGNETGAFGQLVSEFVHSLQADNDTNGTFGFQVATFVLANNPAADMIPDHAGPPENVTQGPPEDAGPPENVTQGPPDDANATDDSDRGPPEDAGDDGGPPDDAGPPDQAGPASSDE